MEGFVETEDSFQRNERKRDETRRDETEAVTIDFAGESVGDVPGGVRWVQRANR